MSKKKVYGKDPRKGTILKNPIITADAMRQYSFKRKWLVTRMNDGRIRWAKAGHHLLLEEDDVKRECAIARGDPESRAMLEKALKRREK